MTSFRLLIISLSISEIEQGKLQAMLSLIVMLKPLAFSDSRKQLGNN